MTERPDAAPPKEVPDPSRRNYKESTGSKLLVQVNAKWEQREAILWDYDANNREGKRAYRWTEMGRISYRPATPEEIVAAAPPPSDACDHRWLYHDGAKHCFKCRTTIEGVDAPPGGEENEGGFAAYPSDAAPCSTCGKFDNPVCSNPFHVQREGHVYKDGVLQISDAAPQEGAMLDILQRAMNEVFDDSGKKHWAEPPWKIHNDTLPQLARFLVYALAAHPALKQTPVAKRQAIEVLREIIEESLNAVEAALENGADIIEAYNEGLKEADKLMAGLGEEGVRLLSATHVDAHPEDAPGGPCSCWKEAENLLTHERTIEWACSCMDHPNSEWCDCPFCVLFRQHWPAPRSAHCPKCGDSLMAEGATKPSACFRCATDYFMGTSPDA